jgi:hypothetical protein
VCDDGGVTRKIGGQRGAWPGTAHAERCERIGVFLLQSPFPSRSLLWGVPSHTRRDDAMPPPTPPTPPIRRGRHPFSSPILRTFTLAGEHGTARRFWLEFGLVAGALLPFLSPLVGLAVVTPIVRLAAAAGGEIGPATACYGPGVQVRALKEEKGGGGLRGHRCPLTRGRPRPPARARAGACFLNLIILCPPPPPGNKEGLRLCRPLRLHLLEPDQPGRLPGRRPARPGPGRAVLVHGPGGPVGRHVLGGRDTRGLLLHLLPRLL